MTPLSSLRPRGVGVALRLLPTVLLLGSCDGGNGWRDVTGVGNRTRDGAAPRAEIQFPDSTHRVPVGDSVYVRVRVSDDVGVDSVVLSGFSLRGSATLGTQVAVPRFEPKTIALPRTRAARDTVIERYLLATRDSLADRAVFVVATVRDSVGNAHADTVRIAIGGPRVEIRDPSAATELRAGSRLKVRVVASDTTSPITALSLILRSAQDAQIARLPIVVDRRRSVDTIVDFQVPSAAPLGDARLRATVTTAANDTAASNPVIVRVLGAAADQRPPTVTFSTAARARIELSDTVRVNVTATDSTGVARVGATLIAIHRLPTRTDTLGTRNLEAPGDSALFTVRLADFGIAQPLDSSTVQLEVTAYAFDRANPANCGAATVARTPLAEPCEPRNGLIFAARPGARTDILLVRGATVRPVAAGDRLADLAADSAGRRLFVSNFSRNRVEILPFGSTSFSGNVLVGSEPWGLAIGVRRDSLYVANSAGTNISVVPLGPGPLAEAQTRRIGPADVRLYGVIYDVATDSVSTVTEHNYSDRPQYIGQISSGQLIYSTLPTAAAGAGTIRIIDPAKDLTREFNRGSEIFTGYAARQSGKGIVVNALTAGLTSNKQITVCPRPRTAAQSAPACVTGTASVVRDALVALRASGATDTRLDLGVDIESIALTDTTFVAVSRDNSAIAFGEGATDPGRVFLFEDSAGTLTGSTTETEDLLGNAAERVIGLGLNGDGSLGVARGSRAYFFDDDLRQEGQVLTGAGTPIGGVALHPLDANYPNDPQRRRAFVSGVDAGGTPYIDVIETFEFRILRRIVIRDRVIGALVAAPVPAGDPEAATLSVRIFGITESGILQIGLRPSDLQ